jgi:hypothetical protein
MNSGRRLRFQTIPVVLMVAGMGLGGAPEARAGNPVLPREAERGAQLMYGGDPDGAIVIFHEIESTNPESPLGFLLEDEARWWKKYCAACDVKWGMVDAAKGPKQPGDDNFLALADKAIALASAQYAKRDSAEMRLYSGIGWTLKARLYALRDEHRATARAGVRAREEFLRASELDPQMTDTQTGLGLYNYYVDSLSGFVKVLRFFMGIPGGNKKEGIRQLEAAITGGGITSVEARFYLAKNLRTYDQQYERAAAVLEPLVERYPENPIFLLLLGNFNLELGRNEKAEASMRAARDLVLADSACAARVRKVAEKLDVRSK